MSGELKYKHGGPVPEDGDADGDDGGRRTGALDEIVDRGLVLTGLVTGLGAAAVTYLVTLAAAFSLRSGVSPELEDLELPHVTVEAAWTVLMNFGAELQQGDEQVPLGDPFFAWGYLNLVSTPIMILVTLGIVAVAGYAIADYGDADTIRGAVGTALLVVPGYLLFAVVVAVGATWTPPDEPDVGPARSQALEAGESVSMALTDAVLYAGLLWPATFAVIGGLLAVGRRRWVAARE